MNKFYLTNECSPKSSNLNEYTELFKGTLQAYNDLVKNAALNITSGIITENPPSNLHIGNNFNLLDVINNIKDNLGLRSLAFEYFRKYPIDNHIKDLDELYESEEEELFQVIVEDVSYDVFYLAFIALNKDFGFTIPTHEYLKQNTLPISSTSGNGVLALYNLFSRDLVNKNFIIDCINRKNQTQLSNFDQLRNILKNPIYSSHFEKSFKNLAPNLQESILRKFTDAITQGVINKPDHNTVKDVTPTKHKCTILELRIYSPAPIRLYFSSGKNSIYLGTLKIKNKKKEQDADIKNSHGVIYRLIKENE